MDEPQAGRLLDVLSPTFPNRDKWSFGRWMVGEITYTFKQEEGREPECSTDRSVVRVWLCYRPDDPFTFTIFVADASMYVSDKSNTIVWEFSRDLVREGLLSNQVVGLGDVKVHIPEDLPDTICFHLGVQEADRDGNITFIHECHLQFPVEVPKLAVSHAFEQVSDEIDFFNVTDAFIKETLATPLNWWSGGTPMCICHRDGEFFGNK